MILKTLKRTFVGALEDYYPDTENEAFFNMLAEQILNMKRVDVSLNLYAVVSGKKHEKFNLALKRLQNYEPIQYIIGDTEFYGLPIQVNSDVLIPRPETEELVDWIITDSKADKTLNILDIGTGSGCISIALAKNLPYANVHSLDISKEALETAKKNATINDVHLEYIEKDILNLDIDEYSEVSKVFDIIVSNPPYIREQEKTLMKSNVLDNEPHLALFVDDNNPLLFYKAIIDFVQKKLRKNGTLYFEINEFLGEEMKHLLVENGFDTVELRTDLSGKDRMIKGIKK